MNKDIIVAEDDDVKIIFYFKVFCELLKECISIYGDTTIENAQQLVKDFHPLQLPISTTDDIVFFSHEPVYHWAMLAIYGERYHIRSKHNIHTIITAKGIMYSVMPTMGRKLRLA